MVYAWEFFITWIYANEGICRICVKKKADDTVIGLSSVWDNTLFHFLKLGVRHILALLTTSLLGTGIRTRCATLL